MAVSPDGRSVYAVAFGSNRMFAFDRNTTPGPSLGSLTLKPGDRGCFKPETTETNVCQGVVGMVGATDVVVSPDSRSVYMADFWSNGLMIFDRDTSGTASHGDLDQKSGVLGCVTASGSAGECTTGALSSAQTGSKSPSTAGLSTSPVRTAMPDRILHSHRVGGSDERRGEPVVNYRWMHQSGRGRHVRDRFGSQ